MLGITIRYHSIAAVNDTGISLLMVVHQLLLVRYHLIVHLLLCRRLLVELCELLLGVSCGHEILRGCGSVRVGWRRLSVTRSHGLLTAAVVMGCWGCEPLGWKGGVLG